jgi:hypothetical protein
MSKGEKERGPPRPRRGQYRRTAVGEVASSPFGWQGRKQQASQALVHGRHQARRANLATRPSDETKQGDAGESREADGRGMVG